MHGGHDFWEPCGFTYRVSQKIRLFLKISLYVISLNEFIIFKLSFFQKFKNSYLQTISLYYHHRVGWKSFLFLKKMKFFLETLEATTTLPTFISRADSKTLFRRCKECFESDHMITIQKDLKMLNKRESQSFMFCRHKIMLVGRSVCHNFLEGQKVTLPCS